MTYRGIFEYEYPTEHKPPVSIDVHLHGDCVRGKIIEWEYRPLEQEPQSFKWCTGCKEYDQEKHCCHRWSKVIRDTVEEMKQEQEPRWIPVSEKLPDPFTFVNATCRSLVDDRENWVVETIYLPIPKEHNPRHYSDWGNIPMLNLGEAEVIAWMERIIPEPYVVEEQGENT